MKALVVVDMQEDYIGKISKYKYDDKDLLIQKINEGIEKYEKDGNLIIYVKNNRKNYCSNLVTGLNLKSNLIFEKTNSSCYSSIEFCNCLKDNFVHDIKIVGIDGNCCIKSTAIDATKNKLNVVLQVDLVGVINKIRFIKTLENLKDHLVKVII